MRKGRGVGYLGKEVQCSHFRVWESKPAREMQRAVLRAHWRFMIINLVTTVTPLFCLVCQAGQNQGFSRQVVPGTRK